MAFIDNSVQVKAKIEEAGVAWLHEACGELEAQTKRNSKVKTGLTKGSYSYFVNESKLEGYVGSNYQNAIWEEFGTGEYALNGDGRKGGWYYYDAEGKRHHTFGKHSRRPFFRAYTKLKNTLKRKAQEVFGGI